jgi:hypothetical protein
LDLRDRAVLLVEGNAPPDFATEALIRGAQAVLWVTSDARHAVRSQLRVDTGAALLRPQIPILRIRASAAPALLGYRGAQLTDLLAEDGASQSGHGWFTHELGSRVRISVSLEAPRPTELPCLLGHKPGSDYDLAGELIVLVAHYDGLGRDPDGTTYPGANDRASAVGVMLELARLWEEQELDARRSVLLIAWPAGTLGDSGLASFLRTTANYRFLPALRPNRPAVVVQLEGVGAGGNALQLHPRTNQHLRELFTEAADQVGVAVRSGEGPDADLGDLALPEVPSLSIAWTEAYVSPELDTVDRVKQDKLQPVGEVLALVSTQMVRQARY